MHKLLLLLALVLTPATLTKVTGEVDAWNLAVMADSLHVPRVVVWAVAWEESRSGSKWNAYRGPGIVKVDSVNQTTGAVYTHRICREIGRMQLSPCIDWTYLSPVCTRRNILLYKYNVYCGVLNLRHKFEIFGDWPEAIRRYNGNGDNASEYQNRVLKTVGRLTLTVPDGTLQRKPNGQS